MTAHDAELHFFLTLLDNFHLPYTRLTNPYTGDDFPDLGLRHLISPGGSGDRRRENLNQLLSQMQDACIYRVHDSYHCHYFFFYIPGQDEYLCIGPYTTHPVTKDMILVITEPYSVSPQRVETLFAFYSQLPLMGSDAALVTTVNTFCSQIWNGLDQFSLQDFSNFAPMDLEPLTETGDYRESLDATLNMRSMEKRYLMETQLMEDVSQGQGHKAEMLLCAYADSWLDPRDPLPLRRFKNYLIMLNTLLRKAAENGTVHPLHIDTLSSRFLIEIEQLLSGSDCRELQRQMVRKYCILVKNHSLKGYSRLIRQVLTRIDSDLTADLSLRAHAAQLNVNASYLSTLFKKETGSALTEYVNRKRIEKTLFLLNSTRLQIQTIAQYCGVPDVNYFTKTFKKQIGITPREYRDQLLCKNSTINHNNPTH